MSRSLHLLCYDVCDPRRLRRVFKLARAYRVAGQKSAFECWLTPDERRTLLIELERIIDHRVDRIHCFALDPRSRVRCFGRATSFAGPPFLIE